MGGEMGLKSAFGCLSNLLVQRPSAVLCSTQARNLVLLQREFVVVGDFFIDGDGLLGVDHDLLLGLDGDHLGVTVWLEEQRKGTGMSGGGGGRERSALLGHSQCSSG